MTYEQLQRLGLTHLDYDGRRFAVDTSTVRRHNQDQLLFHMVWIDRSDPNQDARAELFFPHHEAYHALLKAHHNLILPVSVGTQKFDHYQLFFHRVKQDGVKLIEFTGSTDYSAFFRLPGHTRIDFQTIQRMRKLALLTTTS